MWTADDKGRKKKVSLTLLGLEAELPVLLSKCGGVLQSGSLEESISFGHVGYCLPSEQ